MDRPTSIYICCDPITMEARYVGKTVHDVKVRVQNHITEKGKRHSTAWFRKVKEPYYFTAEVVPAGGDWAESERFWIGYLKSLGARLVNLTSGGEGMVGYKPTKETRAKQSAANKGRTFSPESIAKRVESKKGFTFSLETRQKMSAARKGRKLSEITIEKMRVRMTGSKRSAEAIEKTANANRGRKNSEESKARMSAARQGRVVKEETKSKLSESMKASCARRKALADEAKLNGTWVKRETSDTHRAALSAANIERWARCRPVETTLF